MLGRVSVACRRSGRSLFNIAHPSPAFHVHACQTPFSRFASSTSPVDVASSTSLNVPLPSSPPKSRTVDETECVSASLHPASAETKPEPNTRILKSPPVISNRRLKALKYRLKIPEPLIFLNLTGFRRVVIPQAVAVRDQLAKKAKKGSIDPAEFIDEMNKLETERILKIPQDIHDSIRSKRKFWKFIRLPSFGPRSFRKLISAARAATSFFMVTGDRPNLVKAKRELRFLEEHYMLYFPDIAIRTNSLGDAFSTFGKKKVDSKRLVQIMETGGVEAMIAYRKDLDSGNDTSPVVKTEVPTKTNSPLNKKRAKSPTESIPTQRETVGDRSQKMIEQAKDGVMDVVGRVQESVSQAIESVPTYTSASSAEVSKNMVGASSDKDTPTSTKEQGSSEQTKQSRSDP
ncbi:hypothetical protein [Phaffia rhodozyma]|uniref:Uncharacterized protein n=1 Tax=Phaffia rhodozyma TaxID=264483 RepID=A0A0F7SJ91_PHARH|nr:hypothetical protein [Phaffia rhodozyma]